MFNLKKNIVIGVSISPENDLEVAQVDFENGSPILAKLVRINTDSRGVQQMDWFSTDGLPIHTGRLTRAL